MSWLAVDNDGTEVIFQSMPFRSKYLGCKHVWSPQIKNGFVNLPKGTIETLIGKILTWEDEPVNIFPKEIIKADIEWFEYSDEPPLNVHVIVLLKEDNGDITTGIGQIDEDDNRKTWLIQSTGNMFWRSFFKTVTKWRWMNLEELEEYNKNKTLKF